VVLVLFFFALTNFCVATTIKFKYIYILYMYVCMYVYGGVTYFINRLLKGVT